MMSGKTKEIEGSTENSGCLMAIANILIPWWAKKKVWVIDHDPEVIAATKKAHEAMDHLNVELNKHLEEVEKRETERMDRMLLASYNELMAKKDSAGKPQKTVALKRTAKPAAKHSPPNESKDRTAYIFEEMTYGKSRLVNAVVRSYAQKYKGTTYDALKKAFPDDLQGSYGVFTLQEKAFQIQKIKGVARHYLGDKEMIRLKDAKIATSTEWRVENIQKFIARAKTLNIKIEIKNN